MLYEVITVLDYLPDADSLYSSTLACKEYLGLVYYRLRGWIPGEGA